MNASLAQTKRRSSAGRKRFIWWCRYAGLRVSALLGTQRFLPAAMLLFCSVWRVFAVYPAMTFCCSHITTAWAVSSAGHPLEPGPATHIAPPSCWARDLDAQFIPAGCFRRTRATHNATRNGVPRTASYLYQAARRFKHTDASRLSRWRAAPEEQRRVRWRQRAAWARRQERRCAAAPQRTSLPRAGALRYSTPRYLRGRGFFPHG